MKSSYLHLPFLFILFIGLLFPTLLLTNTLNPFLLGKVPKVPVIDSNPPSNSNEHTPTDDELSLISFDLKVNFKNLEARVNELLSEPLKGKGGNEFDKLYQTKIKNPAYDPVKWIETNDPLYNPKKWIKIKTFLGSIKTKNPLYHPNKKIKIKNLKYSPNRWIKGDLIRLQIGYNYSYEVKKAGQISFEGVSDETMRIKVPIELNGSVGFKGDGAKLLKLDKKNIRGKINFFIYTSVNFDTDWCPKVKVNIDHEWVSDPAIEIAQDQWLNLGLLTELNLKKIKAEVEASVKDEINCDLIREQLSSYIQTSSIPLSGILSGFYLHNVPIGFYASGISINEAGLFFQFALRTRLTVNRESTNKAIFTHLPPLQKFQFESNVLQLQVPTEVNYWYINDQIKAYLRENKLEIDHEMGKAKIKRLQVFPDEGKLKVYAQASAKLSGNWFRRELSIEWITQPIVNNQNQIVLANHSISFIEDGGADSHFVDFFNEVVTSYLKDVSVYDLQPITESVKSDLPVIIQNQFRNNQIFLEIVDTVAEVPGVKIKDEFLSIPTKFLAGFDVELRELQ